MCVDYTDLNKACPRDAYPLPSIDRLVDGAAGHAILSFLDAYSGYNQIPMADEDKIKTTFITEEANLYYKVIPFGLKNVGATYQCLMDRVFQPLLGKSVEIYVDDIIVKSPNTKQHSVDLTQVFKALRAYNITLNHEKCTFRVDGGKFLGFMLTQRGIKANPEKMPNHHRHEKPRKHQRGTAASGQTNRHLALPPEIGRQNQTNDPAPKKVHQVRLGRHLRTKLQHLEATSHHPPVLAKSDLSLPLIMYIAASTNAVSSALVQGKDNTQQPIYFTSRILQDPETWYQMVEKVALAIITAARRLRPYFQSHTIIIRTNHPVQKIL